MESLGKPLARHRLQEEVHRLHAIALLEVLLAAGDKHDAHAVPPAAQLVGELHAALALHRDVEHEQVERIVALAQTSVERRGGGERDDAVGDAVLRQDVVAQAADLLARRALVVAHRHAIDAHGQPPSGFLIRADKRRQPL